MHLLDNYAITKLGGALDLFEAIPPCLKCESEGLSVHVSVAAAVIVHREYSDSKYCLFVKDNDLCRQRSGLIVVFRVFIHCEKDYAFSRRGVVVP